MNIRSLVVLAHVSPAVNEYKKSPCVSQGLKELFLIGCLHQTQARISIRVLQVWDSWRHIKATTLMTRSQQPWWPLGIEHCLAPACKTTAKDQHKKSGTAKINLQKVCKPLQENREKCEEAFLVQEHVNPLINHQPSNIIRDDKTVSLCFSWFHGQNLGALLLLLLQKWKTPRSRESSPAIDNQQDRQKYKLIVMFVQGSLLLMEEIAANQLSLVVFFFIYKVLYIPGGAGFLPSTGLATQTIHCYVQSRLLQICLVWFPQHW